MSMLADAPRRYPVKTGKLWRIGLFSRRGTCAVPSSDSILNVGVPTAKYKDIGEFMDLETSNCVNYSGQGQELRRKDKKIPLDQQSAGDEIQIHGRLFTESLSKMSLEFNDELLILIAMSAHPSVTFSTHSPGYATAK
ncbi:uncharacterized protein BP5553_00391 [Venustampulla echinocandica]|uniref:Uncharacterized protein n=1 Tax=Venustampulla echinocandica TaxID=2656787 RepID=A0A370TY10_9HELO|nr:uncharacterized protein BP5553_00391 [Venustampulla echinocandica]RDL40412.1 hypothetical protein BP5553_00391 [Venustampulla echinocandica]